MSATAQQSIVRISVLLAWRDNLERIIEEHPGPSTSPELMGLIELQNWLEHACEAVGLLGVTAVTHWINSEFEPIVHKGVNRWLSERSLVAVIDPSADWWIERIVAQTGIEDFTLALTSETFNAWSMALEEQAKSDPRGSSHWGPDWRWERAPRHALMELLKMAGDDIHKVDHPNRVQIPPEYVWIAHRDVMVLRDRRKPGARRSAKAIEDEMRGLVRNIERLTGIPAVCADARAVTEP